MNPKVRMGLGIVAISFLLLGAGCIEMVDEGHVGVKQSFGAATGDTVDPGLQIDRPGISYYNYDAREKLYVMSATAGEGQNAARDDSISVIAEDEMTVTVDAAVVWRIDSTKAVDLYTNVGPIEQTQDRVRSKARECIRQEGSRFEGLEMTEAESRLLIKQGSEECMSTSLNEIGVNIIEIQIRDIVPPQRVISAIEEKEATEREVEQKVAELEKEKLESERKQIEAEGIKVAQETIDETLTEEYLDYLWITEGLEKGDTIYVVPSDGGGQIQMVKDIDSGSGASTEDSSDSGED